jgi:hypothetical protein
MIRPEFAGFCWICSLEVDSALRGRTDGIANRFLIARNRYQRVGRSRFTNNVREASQNREIPPSHVGLEAAADVDFRKLLTAHIVS